MSASDAVQRVIGSRTGAVAFSPELADLTETELIAAIHASDYEPTADPSPADLAAFALQGLAFRGRLGVAQDAIHLLTFWMISAENDSPDRLAKARAAHADRFDVEVVAHLSAVMQRKRRVLRSARTGHDCPVCGESHAQPRPDCAAEFASRSWMTCPECEGTGWDTIGMEIYCRTCGGSKMVEAGDISRTVAA